MNSFLTTRSLTTITTSCNGSAGFRSSKLSTPTLPLPTPRSAVPRRVDRPGLGDCLGRRSRTPAERHPGAATALGCRFRAHASWWTSTSTRAMTTRPGSRTRHRIDLRKRALNAATTKSGVSGPTICTAESAGMSISVRYIGVVFLLVQVRWADIATDVTTPSGR